MASKSMPITVLLIAFLPATRKPDTSTRTVSPVKTANNIE